MFKNSLLVLALGLFLTGCNQNLSSSGTVSSGDSSGIIGGSKSSRDIEVSVGLLGGCSGVIISPNLILTAAHCVGANDTEGVYIMIPETSGFGGLFNKVKTEYVGGVTFRHPNFEMTVDQKGYSFVSNDIGLIKVRDTTRLPKASKPIAIFDGDVRPGEKLILAGFGDTSEHSKKGPLRVHSVEVPVQSLSGQRLVMDQSAGRGAFKGDSGGPAFLRTASGTLLVVGTTSGPIIHKSYTSNSVKYPVLYMKTSGFKSLILEQAKRMGAIPPVFTTER